jgi:pseudouridine-5'-phosphate glycosidase
MAMNMNSMPSMPTHARRWLRFSPAAAAARAAGRPLVALESTLIAHGMPYPQNLQTAHALEAEIRAQGAEPATIALMDGRICIGLDDEALERLARDGNARKVSRRDLPGVLAAGGLGATTVSATMICAHLAGIEVFVTGGIGGVHRGAARSFDISADLQELAHTPVAVVCAGAKSILDLRLTLEYLETHGVPVLGYRTRELPAFFCRESGLGVDARLESAEEIARVMQAQWALGLRGGLVVANPIDEAHALPRERVDQAIAAALADAEAQGITGKAVTPFLLARVNALTGGNSLASNIQLVLANARLAAAIAAAFAALKSI